jgi:hypothetical protein
MYILWGLDIKNQEAFYQENVNRADVLHGMLVYNFTAYVSFHFCDFNVSMILCLF